MGLLVNIIAAEEDELEAIAESEHPIDQWSGIEARDIDAAKLATLHCLLTDDDFEQAQAAYDPVFANDYDGVLVVRIPDEVIERLACLEEEALELVGEELAASEEFELNNWSVEEVQAFVIELGDLARLADSQGQALFAWMHPLRT
ncbi:MAG: hypothetical protein DVB25_04670 [Verrucomicrobia bacterium]|nr:MAG: hypothetical protein DVB25_04670 [Verrucomicrobiota bacterium]